MQLSNLCCSVMQNWRIFRKGKTQTYHENPQERPTNIVSRPPPELPWGKILTRMGSPRQHPPGVVGDFRRDKVNVSINGVTWRDNRQWAVMILQEETFLKASFKKEVPHVAVVREGRNRLFQVIEEI